MGNNIKILSSFRDPSGFLFYQDGCFFRQINIVYKQNYDYLLKSGLYKTLVQDRLLVPHEEVGLKNAYSSNVYKIIKPEFISFITYSYEWCFSQLKHAALTTLLIQKKALELGMSLKDCSSYNIQFSKCRPLFIDTLSFEIYQEGQPWVAYRQFCQHFLAPLVLTVYTDTRINQLLKTFMDGIPLDLASKLLPIRSYFVFPYLSHIHLHSKSQEHFSDKGVNIKNKRLTRLSLLALIDNLEGSIRKIEWQPKATEWADYYEKTNYSHYAFEDKKQIVFEFLGKINPKIILDLGSNIGVFSRIASGKGIQVISFDNDPVACEKNYLDCIKNNETNILPLLVDLNNPSPAIGWENQERMSLLERCPVDTVFALALIHHLAISNNLPFDKIAYFCSKICNTLIIEFIPKNDSQIKRLLSVRKDIFLTYTQELFEMEFKKYFTIEHVKNIKDSERILYLMIKR